MGLLFVVMRLVFRHSCARLDWKFLLFGKMALFSRENDMNSGTIVIEIDCDCLCCCLIPLLLCGWNWNIDPVF